MSAYKYIQEGEKQYGKSTFKEGESVDARYRHAALPIDQGNRLIEALPEMRTPKEVETAYTLVPSGISAPIDTKNTMAVLEQIKLLQQLRFPLPFNLELEREVYLTLIDSYRNRRFMTDPYNYIAITHHGVEEKSHSVLIGSIAEGTSSGLALIGASGSGKSSATKFLTSHYPQVIIHHPTEDSYLPQIVYLVVTCSPNSNFRALYESIGKAIDVALGNILPCYETEIKCKHTLAEKANAVRRLIEVFSIGIILFDEIELLNFKRNQENSFFGLLTLCTQCKVGMGIIGTEAAYDRMFVDMQTTRRIGNIIDASAYCANKDYFAYLCRQLFKFQWFEPKVVLTQSLIDALYKETGGIINILMTLYQYMQIEYITRKKKPEVNANFIRQVMSHHFPGMTKFIGNLQDPVQEKERRTIMEKATSELKRQMDRKRQQAYTELLQQDSGSELDRQNKIRTVTDTILMTTDDYTAIAIEEKTEEVLNSKKGPELTMKALTRKVVSKLKNEVGSEKRPKGKRAKKGLDVQHRQMLGAIEEDKGIL